MKRRQLLKHIETHGCVFLREGRNSLKPAKIESDAVTVRIVNRDEMLTEEDMKDILNAMDEREKGNYYKLEEVFE